MTSTKWIQPLGGDLCAILDKIEANMLQTTTTKKNETENGSSKIKNPSTERFQLQMSVPHQSMCVHLQGCSLKFKACQIPIEILEHQLIPNSS